MKYIMIQEEGKPVCPIIFPEVLEHEDVARKWGFEKVVSAGFVIIEDLVGVQAYGISDSLTTVTSTW